MNAATLVDIVKVDVSLIYRGIFDDLDEIWFSWFLIVFDANGGQYRLAVTEAPKTYDSAILRFAAPENAIFKNVKNSVLTVHFISGSGSCGEPIPIENQSSLSVESPMNLIAPRDIVRSLEMES